MVTDTHQNSLFRRLWKNIANKKDKKEVGNGFMDKKSFQLYWEKNIDLIRQNPYIYKTIMTKVISK